MKTTHTSLRFSRKVSTVRTQVRRFARGQLALTVTEAAKFRSAFKVPGMVTIHPRTHPELAAMVRIDHEVVPLSTKGIPRRGGQRPYALAVLPPPPMLVVHLPSGVEGLRGIRANAQGEVWLDCIGALAKYTRTHPGELVIVGDWNVNVRLKWVRELLRDEFPDFHIVRTKYGTHGPRAIDFAMVRGATGTARRQINPASDHRAVRFNIKEK